MLRHASQRFLGSYDQTLPVAHIVQGKVIAEHNSSTVRNKRNVANIVALEAGPAVLDVSGERRSTVAASFSLLDTDIHRTASPSKDSKRVK